MKLLNSMVLAALLGVASISAFADTLTNFGSVTVMV